MEANAVTEFKRYIRENPEKWAKVVKRNEELRDLWAQVFAKARKDTRP